MKQNPKSLAREFAIQFLYQSESEKIFFFSETHFSSFINNFAPPTKVQSDMKRLCKGTLDHLEQLDSMISESSKNWPLARMASTDRMILRLATFEILESITPIKVILNEAIELAKKFGTEQSGKFVNGLLDRLAENQNAEKRTL